MYVARHPLQTSFMPSIVGYSRLWNRSTITNVVINGIHN